MPEISINRALMDTLSEAQREAWVEATPTSVFRLNAITKQARLGTSPAPHLSYLPYCHCMQPRPPAQRLCVPGAALW
jgi:hypothetical protein